MAEHSDRIACNPLQPSFPQSLIGDISFSPTHFHEGNPRDRLHLGDILLIRGSLFRCTAWLGHWTFFSDYFRTVSLLRNCCCAAPFFCFGSISMSFNGHPAHLRRTGRAISPPFGPGRRRHPTFALGRRAAVLASGAGGACKGPPCLDFIFRARSAFALDADALARRLSSRGNENLLIGFAEYYFGPQSGQFRSDFAQP